MQIQTKPRYKHSFPAEDNEGQVYQIHIWVDVMNAGIWEEDPNAEAEGPQTLKMSDGQFVNYLERGKYQVVATGEILTSNHPTAP